MQVVWFNHKSEEVEADSKTLSICSLNINGMTESKAVCLREVLLKKMYDIIALQETWNTTHRKIDLADFTSSHIIRQSLHKNATRGSGGISFHINKNSNIKTKILKSHDDFIVWVNIQDGRELDVAICFVYFPPEGSTCNPSREDYFDVLTEDIRELKEQFPLIIMGDFNARTGSLSDSCYDVDGSDNPSDPNPNLSDSDIFQPHLQTVRQSEDSVSANSYGRKLVDLCRSAGLCILNGRVGDKLG